MDFNLNRLAPQQAAVIAGFLHRQGHSTSAEGLVIELNLMQTSQLSAVLADGVLTLTAPRVVQCYRALHLFLQQIDISLAAIPPIVEQIQFEHVGLMLDASRNGTMQPVLLQEFVRHCAATGVDRIFFYMEDVYEIPQVPSFGAYRGRYTRQVLCELDAYADSMGVEIIPTIQTLAHLHTFLRWSCNASLRDTEDILLVGSPETEQLLRQMIHSVAGMFRSRYIHVGMDEADALGRGQYLQKNGYQTHAALMTQHLALVKEICADEGKSIMMWSDMFLRMASPTGGYYDVPEDAAFSLPQPIDPAVNLVYWDYYQHTQSIYEKNIALHRKLTQNIQFAGGGWTWNGIAPNYSKAKKTLREGLAACRAQGIQQVMCTFWLDNGAETPTRTAFYSALYFTQLCYHQVVDEAAFERWVIQCTGYPSAAHMLLDAFDAIPGVQMDNENADNPSKFLLYQDTMVGLFDCQISANQTDMDAYYATLADQLATVVAGQLAVTDSAVKMRQVFAYYECLARALSYKAMLGIRLTNAYLTQDRAALTLLPARILACAEFVQQAKQLRAEIWFRESHPLGYEVLDIRLGGVVTRLVSAAARVQKYLAGEISALPELETERYLFTQDLKDPDHTLCASGFWEKIVSGANIAGI